VIGHLRESFIYPQETLNSMIESVLLAGVSSNFSAWRASDAQPSALRFQRGAANPQRATTIPLMLAS
jgi:hypothetical protein